MLNENLTRRTFLKVTTLAGTGVLVGCSFSTQPTLSSTTQKEEHLGLWVKITTRRLVLKIVWPRGLLEDGVASSSTYPV